VYILLAHALRPPCSALRQNQRQQLHEHADRALRDGERCLAPAAVPTPDSCFIQFQGKSQQSPPCL
ncbi:hypothetical protein A2U01_0077910, partial [Trifolium medium]|nr:hypothetical protein [Trifolium medium]